MAEEDLLFGKNRHMFGGIEPSHMLKFSISVDHDSNPLRVKINARLPLDTVIDKQTLCTVGGCIIRKRNDRMPSDEFDGELVSNVPSNGGQFITIYDNDVIEGQTYYYAAFPYSKQGVYNRSNANKTSITVTSGYIYGFDLDLNDLNPSTRVTYPSDVDNADFSNVSATSNGVKMGDWLMKAGEKFMPRPVIIDSNGKVIEYLDPNNYTKTITGEDSSYNINDDTINSQYFAMMQWPKIYTKRIVENDTYKFRCSNKKIDSGYECWCNYNVYNEEVDHFYTGIYLGYIAIDDESQLSSAPKKIYSKQTLSNFIKAARISSGNNRWNIELIDDRLLINDLLIMLGKSVNTQQSFGYGYHGNYTPFNMDDKGLFWGVNYSTSKGVKVFGMEHYWGLNPHIVNGIHAYSSRFTLYFNKNITFSVDGNIPKSSTYAKSFICTDHGLIPNNSDYSYYVNDSGTKSSVGNSFSGTDASSSTGSCDTICGILNETSYMAFGGGYATGSSVAAGAFSLSAGLTGDSTRCAMLSYR